MLWREAGSVLEDTRNTWPRYVRVSYHLTIRTGLKEKHKGLMRCSTCCSLSPRSQHGQREISSLWRHFHLGEHWPPRFIVSTFVLLHMSTQYPKSTKKSGRWGLTSSNVRRFRLWWGFTTTCAATNFVGRWNRLIQLLSIRRTIKFLRSSEYVNFFPKPFQHLYCRWQLVFCCLGMG